MDEITALEYQPLDENDLLTLAAMKAEAGLNDRASVDRNLLSRLLCERVLLSGLSESSRWLVKECQESGLERSPRNTLEPLPIEKAMGAVRQFLDAVDAAGILVMREDGL